MVSYRLATRAGLNGLAYGLNWTGLAAPITPCKRLVSWFDLVWIGRLQPLHGYVSDLPAILDAILWGVGAADCEMWNGHHHGFWKIGLNERISAFACSKAIGVIMYYVGKRLLGAFCGLLKPWQCPSHISQSAEPALHSIASEIAGRLLTYSIDSHQNSGYYMLRDLGAHWNVLVEEMELGSMSMPVICNCTLRALNRVGTCNDMQKLGKTVEIMVPAFRVVCMVAMTASLYLLCLESSRVIRAQTGSPFLQCGTFDNKISQVESKIDQSNIGQIKSQTILERLEAQIQATHLELMRLVKSTSFSNRLFMEKETKMKSLQTQLAALRVQTHLGFLAPSQVPWQFTTIPKEEQPLPTFPPREDHVLRLKRLLDQD
ncbi:hypothetical protein TIFTF001_035612 [Ficus carica]|uniref:Uncharacterized protein n=1 Tax=Ficus carica TaxID=3494 RepID=A0AA88E1W9_FICCA|nr:hypothetical protein TIFTF001_035612 [Ficus carica]